MKGLILISLLLIFSCNQKEKYSAIPIKKEQKSVIGKESQPHKLLYNQPWFNFYRQENPDFNPELFQLKQTAPISYQESSVTVMNEKGFNEVYKPFLIFNESKTKYIDFDSYQWFLEPDDTVGFEADQQVVLVDYKNKTARQIAFFGPSFWIEDAFWKGDSVAVLLGNTYEQVPFMMKYNFDKNEVQNFQYPDTLKVETSYSKIRLRKNGIKTD